MTRQTEELIRRLSHDHGLSLPEYAQLIRQRDDDAAQLLSELAVRTRKDIYGNTMYKPSYGKTSEMGWNVDHSKPQALGGTDHLNNLQPMNSRANCSKGKKY